jgi:hypothetical protein
MRQFYDPKIITDYPIYFCRGVQQAANLLYRLSSKYHNGNHQNRYKLKTPDYLIQGSFTKLSQTLDDDYDFNSHTVNEMFEFLSVLTHMKVIIGFGAEEIQLNRSQIERMEEIGKGNYSEEIYKYIQQFDFTSHAKTNGHRVGSIPKISEVS